MATSASATASFAVVNRFVDRPSLRRYRGPIETSSANSNSFRSELERFFASALGFTSEGASQEAAE